MDAPGWDQLVSGEINLAQNVASVAKTRAETSETNSRSQLLDTQNRTEQVALDLAQAKSPLEHQLIQRAMLAQAWGSIDPNDPDASSKADATFSRLRDEGVEDAGQYIGKYTPALQNRMTAAYAADSPLASLEALNGGASGGGGAAATGRGGAAGGAGTPAAYDPAQMAVALSQMNPQQQAQAAQRLQVYKSALAAIDNSQNPAAEFAKQAAALGHPEWADPSKFSPLALVPLRREISAWDQAFQSRGLAEGLGVPAPVVPNEVKEAGGALWSVNPGGTKARPLTPGPSTIVGTDAGGRGVYYSPSSGREVVGQTPLNAKPGTARSTVYEQRRQGWLDVHPGDEQGALDYAAGRGGATHQMGAAQIEIAAAAAAARDVANGVATPDQEGALRQQYAQTFQSAQAQAPTPAAGGGGGWSNAAHATQAQSRTMQQFIGSKSPDGTRLNPLIPRNEGQMQKLPKGTYFIAPDGSIRQKTW